MLATILGNSTETESRISIKGLPALKVPVGRDGYLDGFIVYAKSLRQVYLTKNFEDVKQMSMGLGYEKTKPLSQYRTGSLAALQLMNSWARVQIVKRLTVSKVAVYFVDTGLEQDVDISNLYELPSKLRNTPPLAIPILVDSGAPEASADELQKLKGAKVAVKLKDLGPEGAIRGSELTVFDPHSHNNLPILKALVQEDFDFSDQKAGVLKRAIVEAAATTTVAVTTTMVVSSTDGEKGDSNVAVIIIAVLCILLFLVAIGVAVWCFWKRYRQMKAKPEPEPMKDEAVSIETERACPSKVESEEPELPSVIPLPADQLAVVAATIALGKHERDRRNRMKGLSPPPSEEFTTNTDQLSAKAISIPSPRVRAGAGLSQISSIYGLSQPHCSTPIHTDSIFTPLRRNIYPTVQPEAREDLDLSEYSDILDVRQYIPDRSALNHNIEALNDETIYMTAPCETSD